ncbi:MAG: imidazole glycerol phosphate synthase subunit HisH [Rubricoccaceae bacterium]
MLTLVDYDIGNVRSLAKAFEAAGCAVLRTDDPEAIASADRLVLPGVGAFGACAAALRERGLFELVADRARAGTPLLGVCVGMQLLFEASEERGEHDGLALLPGHVVRFADATDADGRLLKVPHMGWNQLMPLGEHPVVAGRADHVYFVHSYHASPTEPSDVLATVSYGSDVPAIVGRQNVVGVQFHPEKSHTAGLALLRRFADWTPARTSSALLAA